MAFEQEQFLSQVLIASVKVKLMRCCELCTKTLVRICNWIIIDFLSINFQKLVCLKIHMLDLEHYNGNQRMIINNFSSFKLQIYLDVAKRESIMNF